MSMQNPVYQEMVGDHVTEVYANTDTGGYRVFVDKKEYECGWFQLTHASAQAMEIAKKLPKSTVKNFSDISIDALRSVTHESQMDLL